jgi:hypothetical protein
VVVLKQAAKRAKSVAKEKIRNLWGAGVRRVIR